MTDIFSVSISCSSQDEAERIGRALLEARIAACVQLHPIRSFYVWRGEIDKADETMLTVKTRRDKLEALEGFVTMAHSYEVPEIMATRAEWTSVAYAQWLRDTLGS